MTAAAKTLSSLSISPFKHLWKVETVERFLADAERR
jgi:hypothetical protein